MELELFTKNKQVPLTLLTILEEESGDRAFVNRSESGLKVFIVMNKISKKELEEFKGSVSVIYQNYEIPFMILKYKHMSFDMPLIPNTKVDNFTNFLTIYIIDSNGYILKEMRGLGLDQHLATQILSGIDSIQTLNKAMITECVERKIYPRYTMKDMLKGGVRQRFER